jgi:hypothetical protein
MAEAATTLILRLPLYDVFRFMLYSVHSIIWTSPSEQSMYVHGPFMGLLAHLGTHHSMAASVEVAIGMPRAYNLENERSRRAWQPLSTEIEVTHRNTDVSSHKVVLGTSVRL